VLIIVPAYNEAGGIRSVLKDLAVHAPWADVVVIDDGSTDGTSRAVLAEGGRLVRLPVNLGVGGAVQTGYLYAREHGYDIAVQFDGDGQHRANQIPALLEPLTDGRADVVIGSRLAGKRQYRFAPLRWIGSRLLKGLMRLVTGQRIEDPTSGFRAISRNVIGFFAVHYPDTYLGDTVEALVLAARHGGRLLEVPARMRRAEGSSINNLTGLGHTIRLCLAVLIDRIESRFAVDLAARSEGPRQ
jgi:hypothetical protein